MLQTRIDLQPLLTILSPFHRARNIGTEKLSIDNLSKVTKLVRNGTCIQIQALIPEYAVFFSPPPKFFFQLSKVEPSLLS